MKTEIKYAGFALGALVILTMTGASAATNYQFGGEHSTSGVVELFTDVNAPPLPTGNGCAGTTLYWLGGDTTTTTGGNALTQPELVTDCGDGKWKGQFEVASYSTPGSDLEGSILTNVVFSPGGSPVLDDAVYPSGNSLAGENCQFVGDNNNPNNDATHCFHGYTYGSSFYNAYGVFETYDTSGADFSPLDSHSVQFTNYLYYTTPGGAGNSQTLTAFASPTPPSTLSCISETAGTGSATITFSGC
ncbi:MAG: hypothetical protein ACRDFB_05135 [Rhabdochlamydiaceae bacterium]